MKYLSVITVLAALLLSGCGTIMADRLPEGSSEPIPPGRVVVFGKVMVVNKGETKPSWSETFARLSLHFLPARLAKEVNTTWDWQRKISPTERRFWFVVLNGDDFYATLPRNHYLLVEFGSRQAYECRNLGFRAPADATVLYLGTIAFTRDTRTVSVQDDYDQAVRRLRARNPGLKGSVTKALLGHLPVTQQSDLKCYWRDNQPGLIIPII